MLSGTVTPDHFLIESAMTPIAGADSLIADAPSPPNVKLVIPEANEDNSPSNPSGTETPAHFLIDSASTPKGSATAAIDNDPNIDKVLANPPTAISPRASPIAVRPISISSHDIEPNFFNASAKSPNPCTAMSMDPPPMIDAKPPRVPRTPDIVATSAKAPPIPTRPCAISSHDIEPKLPNALDKSPRLCTPKRILPEPKRPDNPANVPSTPDIVATSAKAPPIPTRPCAISSHDIEPKLPNALDKSPRLCTAITNDPEPIIPDNPANVPNNPATVPTSAKAPPIPTRPWAISSQDIEPKFPNALDKSPRP